MAGHRMRYLLTLFASSIVYVCYGEWLGWLLLVAVAALPWLSLAISIPAILAFQVAPTGVEVLEMGEEAELWLLGSCSAPMPPFRGRIRLRHGFTEAQQRYDPDKGVPTDHCGAYQAYVERDRVCDYLGLFSFRVRRKGEKTIFIHPRPVEIPSLPELKQQTVLQWRPKPGGGLGEEYDLRPYRAGDSPSGIHWKLSAKTGSLMVREPLEPEQGTVLLTMTLGGTPEELDRKLGRLLWAGEYLLERKSAFELRVLTARGILTVTVDNRQALNSVLNQLLRQRTAEQGSIREQCFHAEWQYYIGGEADEI